MTLKQLFSLGHLNLYYMKDGDNIKFLDSELLAKLWDKEKSVFYKYSNFVDVEKFLNVGK